MRLLLSTTYSAVANATARMKESGIIADMGKEIAINKRYLGEFGYQGAELQKGHDETPF